MFASSEEGLKACEWFDEFLSQSEFGLALDVLCDFLIDSPTPVISPELVGQIEKLRLRMGGADRLEDLKQKLVRSGPS